jgi:tripartite-type tricarboxylate transporter receptor subunit TctC
VPTFAELGYPDMTVSTHGGIVAPAGTSRAIIDKIHAAVVKANSDPAVRAAVIQGAAVPRTSTPEEFDALIKSDSAIWGEIINRLKIKLD